MEGNIEEPITMTSEVLAFMREHRELTVRESLSLYLQRMLQFEEEKYDRQVERVRHNSNMTMERVEREMRDSP